MQNGVNCVRVGDRVYGLGNTVEIWITRITFRKMSICLIFVVGDENFPSPYSKIYRNDLDTLKYIVAVMISLCATYCF
jgi:hypothetical protein